MTKCPICGKRLITSSYEICFSCEIDKNHKEFRKQLKKQKKNPTEEEIIKRRKNFSQYKKNRLKIDINFKVRCYLGSRIWDALKGRTKSKNTLKLLGCSIEQLKKHLASQFRLGMSWSNYGKWHVDHIKSCNSFDLSREEEQRKCFHYSNLQPLWAKDNLKKKKLKKYYL